MKTEIDKAIEVLNAGGIIIYPSDTVWGIGCDATNPKAVAKIYALKNSENKKGMIVLLDTTQNITKYIKGVPEIALTLFEVADKPLTLILPECMGVAENLIPQEKTLAIRIPKHEFCQQLIHHFGRPLVSTSANISQHLTPLTFNEIEQEIMDGVDLIIDPKWEGNPTRQASSIIQVGIDGEVNVIR